MPYSAQLRCDNAKEAVVDSVKLCTSWNYQEEPLKSDSQYKFGIAALGIVRYLRDNLHDNAT